MTLIYIEDKVQISSFFIKLFKAHHLDFHHIHTLDEFEDYVSQVPATTMDLPLSHPPVIQVNPELDALESRLDAREWWLYPLRHPISVGARFFRYALRFISAWNGKK